MATLTIPHTFLAGTPALASEVNANFQAVVSWTQGQISTDNLGILGARSIALPTSPTFAILSLSQTSSNIALNINNSGTDSSIVINQSGSIASGKGAILINSPSTQVTPGAAELLLSLATNSDIPAILVNHGAVQTMSLTRSALNLFSGTLQASLSGLSVNNINTSGLITATAPDSDAISVKIKGRSINDTSIIQFKSNDDTIEQARLTVNPGGLAANIPTGNTYAFQINNNDKVVIDNEGIDGQYLTNASIPKRKMVAVGQQTQTGIGVSFASSGNVNQTVLEGAVTGSSVTITTTGRPVLVCWAGTMYTESGSGAIRTLGSIYVRRNSGNIQIQTAIDASAANSAGSNAGVRQNWWPFGGSFIDNVAAGTYTYDLYYYSRMDLPIGGAPINMASGVYQTSLTVFEL